MPKETKFLEEEIVNAAYEIAEREGIDAVHARVVAKKLNCSVQPIYYKFGSIENLHNAVMEKAMRQYSQYLRRKIEGQTPIAALGWNYFHFLRDYPHLFKLLFINARRGIKENIQSGIENNKRYAVRVIQENYGLDAEKAENIYIKIGLLCQGIAFGVISGTASLSDAEYKRHITEVLEKLIG
jgi:AcrR family transcriptional regulator